MHKTLIVFALAGISLTTFTGTSASADEVYTFVVKKQEEKKATRWSLAEWLETRDRMRLMDLWLALHTPTPFEFYISPEYQLTGDASDVKKNALRLSAAAYASIFGLEVIRSFSPYEEFSALTHLRVFGYHSQGTNITFQAGVRSQSAPIDARNAVIGLSSTIYLAKYFGVDGSFKHNFLSVPNAADIRSSGNRWDSGAFIDFKFLRVYGKYFSEIEKRTNQPGQIDRSGVLIGTRLYF